MTHFIIDENLSYDLVEYIKKKGHRADHIKKLGISGSKTIDLYKIIAIKKSWFITKDKDFSIKEKFDKFKVGGIICLFLSDDSTKICKDYIDIVFENLKDNFSEKKLIVLKDKEMLIL